MTAVTGLSSIICGMVSTGTAFGSLLWAKKTGNPKLTNMAGMMFATIGAAGVTAFEFMGSLIAEPSITPLVASLVRAATTAASGATIALAATTIGTLAQSPTATTREKIVTTAASIAAIGLIVSEIAKMNGEAGIFIGATMTLGIGMAAAEAANKAQNYFLREGVSGSTKALLSGAIAAIVVGMESPILILVKK